MHLTKQYALINLDSISFEHYPDFLVVDVVAFFVILNAFHATADMNTCSGRAYFGIRIYGGHDMLRQLGELSPEHTVVDVDLTDVIESPDRYTVITGEVCHYRLVVGESFPVCVVCASAVALIWHLLNLPIAFFILPQAEQRVFLEFTW